MAQIPDERLERLAETVGARKVTPAAVRVVDVPGTGPQLLGNLRQVDALLVVLDGFSGTRVPADDLETLKLELLVADRDHVERRLERVGEAGEVGGRAPQGGGRGSRAAAGAPRRRPDAGGVGGRAAPRARAADDEAAARARQRRPTAIDLQLEAELAELSPEEAAEFRGGGESALGEVVRRLAETLDLITFFTAGDKETRAWTLRRGETALDAAETIHSDIARGFIRCEVVRWDDLVAGRRSR